jgi:hypothetical protein
MAEGSGRVTAVPIRSSITRRFKRKPLCRLFACVQRLGARLRVINGAPATSFLIPVSDILTIASSDRLVQQSNGVITREVEATHSLRRGIIVTSDDCIAIETDEVFVLRVHRRSATPFLPSMFVGRPQASDDSLKGAGRHHPAKATARHKPARRRQARRPPYEASTWNGVAVPRGTPQHIIEKLNREINTGAARPCPLLGPFSH